jgi:hypothetical protein
MEDGGDDCGKVVPPKSGKKTQLEESKVAKSGASKSPIPKGKKGAMPEVMPSLKN